MTGPMKFSRGIRKTIKADIMKLLSSGKYSCKLARRRLITIVFEIYNLSLLLSYFYIFNFSLQKHYETHKR